jgi:phenylpropionate dioxygenase-like ring-hydroxylating dioxygenase large terminal subunit
MEVILDHPRIVQVVRGAWAEAHRADVSLLDREGTIPTWHYTDAARLDRERARLFRALPIPIAHASELPPTAKDAAAEVLVRELDGVSLLLTRGDDGKVRGFRNSCRHRGVRLVREDCRKKAFVCPYHGWTYDTCGALRHVPHAAAFPSLALAERSLSPVRIEERHGIVWASLEESAPDVRAHLGEIDDELASLGLGEHVSGQRVLREQRGNWKMLMEGFLEGYHIRSLHRDSVYPFFLDARSVAERAGSHVRAASARRSAREVKDDAAFAARPLREIATVSYTVFPATTLIAHPDWTSLVVVQPIAPDRFLWSHTQLIALVPATEQARAHFARSFALIEGNVFEKEDLRMCAEAQAGLETGANDVLLFGRLESPALWFHDAIEALLS